MKLNRNTTNQLAKQYINRIIREESEAGLNYTLSERDFNELTREMRSMVLDYLDMVVPCDSDCFE